MLVEGVPGKGDSGRVYTGPDLPLEAAGQGWGLGSCEDSPHTPLTSECHLRPPALTEAWLWWWLQPSFFSMSQGRRGPLHLTRFGNAGIGA